MLGMDVHLPCSFGDKVYYISGIDKIKEGIIRGFRIYQYCILYDVYDKEEDYYFVMESDEVYFTKEKAEEALKKGGIDNYGTRKDKTPVCIRKKI